MQGGIQTARNDAGSGFASVSAPFPLALLGHYQEMFGLPGIYVAVEARSRCMVQVASRFMVNQEEMTPEKHPHVRGAVLYGWPDMDRPLAFSLEPAELPGLEQAGTAASTVSCLGAISMLQDHILYRELADTALRVLADIGAGTMPLAVSAAAYGRCVMGAPAGSRELPGQGLWSLDCGSVCWELSHVTPPQAMTLVLARMPNIQGSGDAGEKVKRFYRRNALARDIMADLGALTLDAMGMLAGGDLAGLGECMDRGRKLLANLGAADAGTDRLARICGRHAYGVIPAGAGGNGTVLVLARDSDALLAALGNAGAEARVLEPAAAGTVPEDD